jgi:hypothetical protein
LAGSIPRHGIRVKPSDAPVATDPSSDSRAPSAARARRCPSFAVSLIGSESQIALVDSLAAPVDFPADASTWSIDCDPNVDRLRVMNSSGLNFRVDPISVPIDGDSDTVGPIEPDRLLSGLTAGSAGLAGAAYTNSWGGAPATTLYVADAEGDKLCYSVSSL